MWQGSDFPVISKTSTLLYVHNMPSKHGSTQCQIIRAELYHPVKSSDEKFYICEICHKHLNKNEIPCQAICNKMA